MTNIEHENNDSRPAVACQVQRTVRPDSEARHLPTPEDLRSYAEDADQHGNHWVPIAPASLRGIADEIERLRAAAGQASFCLRTLSPDDADAQMTVRMLNDVLGGCK